MRFDPKAFAVDFVDKYNAVVSAAIILLGGIFGVYWYLFAAFFVLNVFDYCTGWAKARYLKIESSNAGFWGIVRKVFYWVLVAVVFLVPTALVYVGRDMLDLDLSFLYLVSWFTLGCMAVNEARSVCENLVQMKIKVPKIFIKGLAVAGMMMKHKAAAILPDTPEDSEDE